MRAIRHTENHSREADAGQEVADQILVFSADVSLEGRLHPVLDVTHAQHPAGVPADRQRAQRGAQQEIVPPQLAGGAEAQQCPQTGVQEDLAQRLAGQGEAPPAVVVQEGEEVQQTLAVQLGEMHGRGGDREQGSEKERASRLVAGSPCYGATVCLRSEYSVAWIHNTSPATHWSLAHIRCWRGGLF